jgi:3-hydroxyacyl-CoA dehydrogenase
MTEPLSEETVQALERKALMSLFKTEASLARMQHMLDTGKPLRN